MLTSGTAPPAGVWASKPAFTEPFDASLVATVQVAGGQAEADLLVGHVAAALPVPA